MTKNEREVGVLTKDARERCVKEIVAYFLDERDEEIGIVAAENILDFILDKIGSEVYNKAVDDSKKVLQEQLEGVAVEFDVLKRM